MVVNVELNVWTPVPALALSAEMLRPCIPGEVLPGRFTLEVDEEDTVVPAEKLRVCAEGSREMALVGLKTLVVGLIPAEVVESEGRWLG